MILAEFYNACWWLLWRYRVWAHTRRGTRSPQPEARSTVRLKHGKRAQRGCRGIP